MQTLPFQVARPIERKPLHEEAAQRLRELITEGALAAGSRLNERVLCERLGVSRTPLREAFKVLAAERLIELSPNRGARVVLLGRRDIEDLFELMAELEGLSGALAARRRSDAELAGILAMHARMKRAHAARDLPGYYRLNRLIHEAINRAAHNPVLAETYDAVNMRIQNLRFRSNFDRRKWDAAMREHDAMAAALKDRDAPALRRLLEQHLLNKRDAVLAELQAPGPAAADAAQRRRRSA